MQRLHPGPPAEVITYAAYRPAEPAAAMLRVGMVSSLEGRVVDADGRSGSLGGEGDGLVFSALRHLADGIIAGAGTVRAEDYGGMRISDELRPLREADGRSEPAPIIVVTASLDLDPGSRLFTEAKVAPIVVTTTDAADGDLAPLREAGARILQAGEGQVDLADAITGLRERFGLLHLLCEGGPTLNGLLLDAGLVDEICLTLAPTLAGGDDERRIVQRVPERIDLQLASVHEHEGELLLRYRRG